MLRRVLLATTVSLVLASAASASSSLPRFYGCAGTNSAVRPQSILIACGDGNYVLAQIHWSRWTARSAAGVAVAHINDCKPNCTVGTFHWYRHVTVSLTRPKRCSNHERLFTRITWTFRRRRPDGIPRRSRRDAPFWVEPHCP